MRKVIVDMRVSLDGFIEGPDGKLDWAVKEYEKTRKDVFDLQKRADTLLLGRLMYPGFEKILVCRADEPVQYKK